MQKKFLEMADSNVVQHPMAHAREHALKLSCNTSYYHMCTLLNFGFFLKELRTFEPKSVHILNFPGHFLINYSKMNLKDFIKPVLSICQKNFLVMTKKLFETTNDGVRSTGTVLLSIKIQKMKILKI